MADTEVTTDVDSTMRSVSGFWGPYWIDKDIGALIYLQADDDVVAMRTTDAGDNWSSTNIETNNTVKRVKCYFDRETPGDNGSVIHIISTGNQSDGVMYNSFDIDADSVGTEVEAITTTTTAFFHENVMDIVKTQNGNLYIVWEGTNDDVFYRSTNGGTTWGSRTTPTEGTDLQDGYMLFPANTADDADVACIFWDNSADTLTIKMYDDSANTWTESSITTGVTDSDNWKGAGCSMHSNGHIMFIAKKTTGTNDLLCWDINPDSISSPTVTARTSVLTSWNKNNYSLVINQQNDDIYVAYSREPASTELIYYKISDDDGATWGTEQSYSESDAQFANIARGGSISNDGGRLQWWWYDGSGSPDSLHINLVNDIEIEGVVARRRVISIT